MKLRAFVVVFTLVVLGFVARAVQAQSCGVTPVKPVAPVGCRDLVARCVLDSNGHTHWEWICVPI